MKPLPHHYDVRLSGGPDGYATSTAEGLPDLRCAAPADFDGPGDAWSPEHMLIGAVQTCFLFTLRSVARPRVGLHKRADRQRPLRRDDELRYPRPGAHSVTSRHGPDGLGGIAGHQHRGQPYAHRRFGERCRVQLTGDARGAHGMGAMDKNSAPADRGGAHTL